MGEPKLDQQNRIELERKNSFEIPKTMTLEHFWDGIETGNWRPPTHEEISLLADQQLNHEMISELSAVERKNVRDEFINKISHRVNSIDLRNLAINNLLFLDNKSDLVKQTRKPERLIFYFNHDDEISIIDLGTHHFSKGSALRKPIMDYKRRLGISAMTPEEKTSFFSSPENWHNDKAKFYSCGGNSKLTLDGIRSLERYGYNEDNFKSRVEEISRSCGHSNLRMLDIGGASGRALHDAKKICPNLETYNLTIDEQPAMYPVNHLYLCPAEAMPKELEERMDFIISRTAFRYFMYPYIGLRNAIKALSVGGFADIYFSSECSENPRSLNEGTYQTFKWIKKLEKEGFIKTNIPDEETCQQELDASYEDDDTFDRYPGYNEHLSIFMEINKLKSIL